MRGAGRWHLDALAKCILTSCFVIIKFFFFNFCGYETRGSVYNLVYNQFSFKIKDFLINIATTQMELQLRSHHN